MTNNIAVSSLNKIIPKFKNILNKSLSNSIDDEILTPLANMLALYHYDKTNEHEDLANLASTRLKSYLGKRIVIDYDFSVVLGLFSIAITDAESYHENITENIKYVNHKNSIIKQISSDISDNETDDGIEEFIGKMITKNGFSEILNYMHSRKKEIKEIFTKLSKIAALKHKEDLHRVFFEILNERAQSQNQKELFKNSIEMLCSIGTCAAMASFCIYGLDIVASMAIIPSTILGLKILTKPIKQIVDKVTDQITKTPSNIDVEKIIEISESQSKIIEKSDNLDKVTIQEAQKFLSVMQGDQENQNTKAKYVDKLMKNNNDKQTARHHHK